MEESSKNKDGKENKEKESKEVKDGKEIKDNKEVKEVKEEITLTEADKQQLLQLSEISLWIDSYDDLFSDFDPRPYSQRAISEDLLIEAQRASRDLASGKGQLKFLVPTAQRSNYQENVIKKRLKDYFKKHLDNTHKEIKKVVKQGVSFAAVGAVLMLIATFILFKYAERSLVTTFLVIFLEPAGWYFFWEGLNLIIFETKKLKPNHEFYEKMSKCEVTFTSY